MALKRTIAFALLAITFVSNYGLALQAQNMVQEGPWQFFRQEHPAQSYDEIPIPFTVREIRGTITYSGGKALKNAYFEIGLAETTLGTDTDSKGWFELNGFRFFGPFVRSAAIRPGTYRFKVTKDGFHSAVGTLIVSRNAPKESAINIDLKPGEGYHEERPKPAPDEQLLPSSAAIPVVETHKHKKFPEKHAIIYAPVSLAVGRVRTAEFPVVKELYDIMIQVAKPKLLPFHDVKCMLGDTQLLPSPEECADKYSLLRADWTVWDDGKIVQWGSSRDNTACIYGESIYACLANFMGDAGKKYVVQVRFTKDGSPLNVADPRLIVIKHGDMW